LAKSIDVRAETRIAVAEAEQFEKATRLHHRPEAAAS
jgi:hypothetical protein